MLKSDTRQIKPSLPLGDNLNIFITGTDTDIGKTVTSAWICRNSDAKYWKPIQTGEDSDAETVRKFSPKTEIIPNVYRLTAPLSAYDSARLEGTQIDISKIFNNESLIYK